MLMFCSTFIKILDCSSCQFCQHIERCTCVHDVPTKVLSSIYSYLPFKQFSVLKVCPCRVYSFSDQMSFHFVIMLLISCEHIIIISVIQISVHTPCIWFWVLLRVILVQVQTFSWNIFLSSSILAKGIFYLTSSSILFNSMCIILQWT